MNVLAVCVQLLNRQGLVANGEVPDDELPEKLGMQPLAVLTDAELAQVKVP